MKKIIILMLLFFNTATHFLKAQEVTSSLTLITTDLMRATNNNNFSWRYVSYNVMQSSTYARQQGPCVPGQYAKIETDKEGNMYEVTYRNDCDGTPPYVVKRRLIASASSTLEQPENPQGGGGSSGGEIFIPWNPSLGSGIDNPPPPTGLPTDQGGGGTYNPNDPHSSPTSDPDKDPKGPDKPHSTLGDDQPKDSLASDTLKPTKVDCPDSSANNGQKLTQIFNSIDTTQEMNRLRDSAQSGKFESGFSIAKDSANSTINKPFNFVSSTSNISVPTSRDDSVKTIIGAVHIHLFDSIIKANNFTMPPSPPDLYYLVYAYQHNHNFQSSFVYSADGSTYALSITNPSLISSFLTNYPVNTSVTNNFWSGDINTQNTMMNLYSTLYQMLKNKNYEKHNLHEYATVAMLYQLYPGVKMYKKDDAGNFKELDVVLTQKGSVIDIEVIICK